MEDEAKLIKMYETSVKSAQLPKPERGLLSSKCPKCGAKLKKSMHKQLIVATDGGSEFSNRVVKAAGLPYGGYNLEIELYACSCGYEYAKCALTDINE